jgi:hypothetical protein
MFLLVGLGSGPGLRTESRPGSGPATDRYPLHLPENGRVLTAQHRRPSSEDPGSPGISRPDIREEKKKRHGC